MSDPIHTTSNNALPTSTPPVLSFTQIGMSFAKPSGELMPVLQGIDLDLHEGEILGLLGRSGSGKSTLLRIAAGLIKPTAGAVHYQGQPLGGPTEGIAVVFQTFALYPWLDVLENVALGLDAAGVPLATAERKAQAAIELIGLDGFELAYPREISGGMRQRVGFARALVSEPTLLLMDEPFSALDVLTAENLRTDFLDLWIERRLPTKAVLMVTHNIEEAVAMCDHILVLGTNPGHIAASVPISLPHPRSRTSSEFQAVVGQIYAVLTSRMVESLAGQRRDTGLAQRLPEVSSHRIDGFLDTLAAQPNTHHFELSAIAAPLRLKIDELLPVALALHILEFGELNGDRLKLTAVGQVMAACDDEERRRLFREHLLKFVPIMSHICEVLDEREGHSAPRERFELELQDHLNKHDADATLRTAVDWGRYARLFTYDDQARVFQRGGLAV
ncbi:MAG: nitrate/sulfonate/bicarbonate ABC transporter ATP-binding protein [Burkholderiales bacterium]|nr:nitrate/sulfonate/bicarbonate ABC transporter ATP-binding protein [Burkholderiales bacterium]